MTKTKKNAFSMLAILSILFLTTGTGEIGPAIQSIAMAFPGTPLTTILLVLTLPILVMIPTTILSGMLAGSKVKYKTLAATGILFFVVAGVAPAFTHINFAIILIERAVFGLGVGIIFPLGNALILGLYDGQKRAKMLGIGTMIMNLGGIILQLLGGLFAGIKWYYSFYPYLLGIISLILVLFFLSEPAKAPQIEGESKPKVKIPGGVCLTAILFGIAQLLSFPLLANMSVYLAIKGLGDAAVAGIMMSAITVGGALGGATFSYVYKLTKHYVIAVYLFCIVFGYALILYSGNIIFVGLGAVLAGVGIFSLLTASMVIIGMMVTPAAFAVSSSIIMVSLMLANFIATYWIGLIGSITGDPVLKPFFIGMIILAIIGAIFLFVNPIPKPKTEISQEQ